MANAAQMEILKRGVEVWNKWRRENPLAKVDLTRANLTRLNLKGIKLWGANLGRSNLFEANLPVAILTNANLKHASLKHISLPLSNLEKADLTGADLTSANLIGANLKAAKLTAANLTNANLTGAILSDANLLKANLLGANLTGADLEGACLAYAMLKASDFEGANLARANLIYADLSFASLSGANLEGSNLLSVNLTSADLKATKFINSNLQSAILVGSTISEAVFRGCHIFGLSVWNLQGVPNEQSRLVVTADDEPTITVDDLQVAQFIHLLLKNRNVRNVIETITSKAVLILGRFTDGRKRVLDAIHSQLRNRNYLPILFDFEGPPSRDKTETISTLAHMARFVIADITDARSIPQELQAIVPNLLSVPVLPMLQSSKEEYALFEHIKRYQTVLPTYYYQNIEEVISALSERILSPLEAKVKELTNK